MMKPRTFQIALVDTFLSGAGFIAIGYGIYNIAVKDVALAAMALGAGLVLLLAATIDRFESVKGLGMEAKTRKLDATINKAELAVSQLKDLAELVGGTLLSLTGGTPQAYDLSRQVRRLLIELGSSEEVVRAALMPWAKGSALEMFYAKSLRMQAILMPRIAEIRQTRGDIDIDAQLESLSQAEAGERYVGLTTAGFQSWPLEEFAGRMTRMFEDAPLLNDEQRDEARPEFAAAAGQLRILAAKLDFGDMAIWASIKPAG